MSRSAARPNLVGDWLAGFGTQFDDVDLGALAGEKQGNGAADAAAAAGDNGRFSG
jgi:hypothetical protein